MDGELFSWHGALTAANLSLGIWLAALGASWLFSILAFVGSVSNRRRRLVRVLRSATTACVAELVGLTIMVAIANVSRWNFLAWLASVCPFLLALLAVVIASGRGQETEPTTLEEG